MSQFLVKVFAILSLTQLKLVCFSVNYCVISTRLLLKEQEQLVLTKEPFTYTKSPEDLPINFLGYTRLNLTNC